MRINIDLIRDISLKDILSEKDSIFIGKCDFCGEDSCKTVEIENNELLYMMFSDLLDYFERDNSENGKYLWDYLYVWNVFEPSVSKDSIRKIVQIVFDNKDVKIIQDKIKPIIKIKDEEYRKLSILGKCSWEKFCNIIKTKNRFFSNIVVEEQLENALEILENKCKKDDNKIYYRARINDESHYDGTYKPEEMLSPPAKYAASGRLNSDGISCFYVCEKKEVTYYEVRAMMHDRLSVASFKLNKDLKIVDLTKLDNIGPFFWTDNNINWFIVNYEILEKINKAISRPQRRFDSKIDYIPTQFICDFIKSKGYDGIKFYSTMNHKDINYAFFSHDMFEFIKNELVSISDIKYSV